MSCPLERLSEDVLVHQIGVYLDIPSLNALCRSTRALNSAFNRHSTVWQYLLCHYAQYLPRFVQNTAACLLKEPPLATNCRGLLFSLGKVGNFSAVKRIKSKASIYAKREIKISNSAKTRRQELRSKLERLEQPRERIFRN